jgi:hypothetical protein
MSTHLRTFYPRSKLAVAIAACLASTATFAQDQDATTQELEEVVVTGFRGSLNTALAQKREETAAIDVIASEDIGKFPDSNLAESMQRVPSVALSRGDGGEGKNISVRGLGPTFTRVRINGMEGASQTGSSDIYGAGNGGRGFDFNVFPTEIFSQLAVRKTTSADVEEGSLGATVDLRAPRPLDLTDDTVLTMTARGSPLGASVLEASALAATTGAGAVPPCATAPLPSSAPKTARVLKRKTLDVMRDSGVRDSDSTGPGSRSSRKPAGRSLTKNAWRAATRAAGHDQPRG